MITNIKRLVIALVFAGAPFAFAGTGNGGPSLPRTGTVTFSVGGK